MRASLRAMLRFLRAIVANAHSRRKLIGIPLFFFFWNEENYVALNLRLIRALVNVKCYISVYRPLYFRRNFHIHRSVIRGKNSLPRDCARTSDMSLKSAEVLSLIVSFIHSLLRNSYRSDITGSH